jgi:drug/metabolite transporter (DMT)-like permease
MPVGYALALFQLSVILTVILGHKVFREEKLWQKLLGSAIMISGSIIIIILK